MNEKLQWTDDMNSALGTKTKSCQREIGYFPVRFCVALDWNIFFGKVAGSFFLDYGERDYVNWCNRTNKVFFGMLATMPGSIYRVFDKLCEMDSWPLFRSGKTPTEWEIVKALKESGVDDVDFSTDHNKNELWKSITIPGTVCPGCGKTVRLSINIYTLEQFISCAGFDPKCPGPKACKPNEGYPVIPAAYPKNHVINQGTTNNVSNNTVVSIPKTEVKQQQSYRVSVQPVQDDFDTPF